MAKRRYETLPELVDTDVSQVSPINYQPCPPQEPLATPSDPHVTFQDHGSRMDVEYDSGQEVVSTEKSASPDGKLLRNPTHQVCLRALIDVCLATLPCLFISLAIVAACLNSQPTSSYGSKVAQAARLGPTIFPIAFAAIVARFNKHLARWQAERGQRLGILEQLVQSTSFAGSIEAAYSLRSLSLVGFSIALLWTFSPIGGQSSLRVLSVIPANIQSQGSVYGPIGDTVSYFGGLSHQVSTQNVINGLITSSLLAPESTRIGPTDNWGNVKIPASSYVANLDTEVWYTADEVIGFTKYSSLLGIPTWEVPNTGNVNFSIIWPIFNTDCNWNLPGYDELDWCNFGLNQTEQDVPDWCQLTTTTESLQQCIYNETDDSVAGPYYTGSSVLDFEQIMDYSMYPNETQAYSNSTPRYMDIMVSLWNLHQIDNRTYPGSKMKCTVHTIRAEVEVSYDDGSCRATKIQKTNDPRPDFINPWNDATIAYLDQNNKLALYSVMLEWLPQTTGKAVSTFPTPFDAYLGGWEQPFSQATIYSLDWSNVTGADFSERLSIMLNTFWLACQWQSSIADRSDLNVTDFFDATTGELFSQLYQQSTAIITHTHQVYRANYVWITALIIVSTILLFCAFASLLFRVFTIAPDILGFVSSLTRDSPHFEPLPLGSSFLDGEQRARQLRDMKVQILDVRPNAEVGHIAFAMADETSGIDSDSNARARIVKGRLYD